MLNKSMSCKGGHVERGVALLASMLLLVVFSSYALLSRLNVAALVSYQQDRSARALSDAKSALIGYALTYAETHPGQPQGYLPCPDADGNGSADSPCGATGTSVIGRLPWRTLDIEPIRDGSGECLWYAVSGNFKASSTKAVLTSDTDGLFDVQDSTGTVLIGAPNTKDRAAAILFAPGPVVGNQNRSGTPANRTECGSTIAADAVQNAANFLEAVGTVSVDNATGAGNGGTAMPTTAASRFVMSPTVRDAAGTTVFNDIVEAITPSDFVKVYPRMDRWVAERVRTCLATYSSSNGGRYPWTSVLNAAAAPDYIDDVGQRFGRIPAAPLNNTAASALGAGNPAMSSTWTSDPNDAMQTCFDEGAAQQDWSWWWWTLWKESVFFAVDNDFSPVGTASAVAALSVDGSSNAQAVVVVAGRTLLTVPPVPPPAGQARTNNAEWGDIAQYLEGANIPALGSGAIPTGDESFANAAVSSTFNDVVCNSSGC